MMRVNVLIILEILLVLETLFSNKTLLKLAAFPWKLDGRLDS